jgi:hypothetical protein
VKSYKPFFIFLRRPWPCPWARSFSHVSRYAMSVFCENWRAPAAARRPTLKATCHPISARSRLENRPSLPSIVETMTNEQVFLNPQMPQIDADGESDKRTHLVVEAPSRARASGQTGGWHNRLHKGTKGLLGLQSASPVFICGFL